jgi:IS5 family transposase
VPADRAHEGWHEHEAACCGGCHGPPDQLLHDGRTSQGLYLIGSLAGWPAQGDWLLGDRGYDADWFRDALEEKGITPCIPGRKSRTKPVKYDKRRYKSRNSIEIMFGRLKDWRRVATRYNRCPTVFLSAVALAATVLF